jgi:hypothetical protein
MREGLAITASFAASAVSNVNAGNYQGRVISARGVSRAQDNHGLITINLTSSATFTGNVRLGDSSYPFIGELHPSGFACFGQERSPSLTITRPDRTSLLLSFGFNLAQRTFTGQVGVFTRMGIQPISTFSGGRKRDPLAAASPLLANLGSYEVKMTQVNPAPGTPNFPTAAESSFTGTLNRSGSFALLGTLSDGTKVTARADLLESGEMVLYNLLPANSGSLNATLNWSENTPGFSAEDGVWFRPVSTEGTFPFGWPDGLIFTLDGAH